MAKATETNDPGPSVKDRKTYEALRREGNSKEKSARIANAKARGDRPSEKGGRASAYEDRTKADLMAEAKTIGIAGRSRMSKGALIDALRNH